MNFDCRGWRITPIELRPPYVSANPGETKPAAIPLSQRQTLSRQSRPPLIKQVEGHGVRVALALVLGQAPAEVEDRAVPGHWEGD
jgi:IS30 family transposase